MNPKTNRKPNLKPIPNDNTDPQTNYFGEEKNIVIFDRATRYPEPNWTQDSD